MIALVGSPNVGKSTIFNALTGLRQHTGNWPGKTVSIAQGRYTYKGKSYLLVDLPGTYSLLSQSEEERIAIDFITSGLADCIIVVVDALCLERNLSLVLQVMELHSKPLICVNLLDEAHRHQIQIDLAALSRELGIPAVGTSAGKQEGLERLKECTRNLCDDFLPISPRKVGIPLDANNSWHQKNSDITSQRFAQRAEEIKNFCVSGQNAQEEEHVDQWVLGPWTGRLFMLGLLMAVFWLTIEGANYPSLLLQRLFNQLGRILHFLLSETPYYIQGLLLDGIYATSARVISVMLPPMAIFFPLFTLLEDLGYLPRAAFLMDHCFERCGSCGKQLLTMSMGFGCNAAGVTGCRIISSPKERLLAITTNALVPCNGKFPAIIVLISLFFSEDSLLGAILLTLFILLAVGITLLATKALDRTVFVKQESRFILEIPPYRRPQWRKVLIRAFCDRTILVLGRAFSVAAPAGALLWFFQQLTIHGQPALLAIADFLNPIGIFMGLNGIILLAFILSFPANELLLPCLVMLMTGGTQIVEMSTEVLGQLLFSSGWTGKTALCSILFLMFHWPCGTTCLTIRKETGSWAWTLVSVLLPTAIGFFLSSLVAHL